MFSRERKKLVEFINIIGNIGDHYMDLPFYFDDLIRLLVSVNKNIDEGLKKNIPEELRDPLFNEEHQQQVQRLINDLKTAKKTLQPYAKAWVRTGNKARKLYNKAYPED